MSHAIGTLAWTRETGGALNKDESRRLFRDLFGAQLSIIPDEWLHKLGVRKARAIGLSPEDLTPPDSAAASSAARACSETSPAYLYNHCERSYGWARILGAQLGLEPDPELLYVAAMFHDFGLTEIHGNAAERPECFSLISANEAARNLSEAGWSDEWIDRVCEAITLHLNLAVDVQYGPEAHLLNMATALDTTGIRKWNVAATDLQMVLDRHPRLDQNSALATCWTHEAQGHPSSRAGWLERNVKFSRRLRNAPFT